MKTFNLTDIEIDLIADSLKEYEEKYYESSSQRWQKIINNLMEKF